MKNKTELDEVELVLPVPVMGLRQGNNSFAPSNGSKDDLNDVLKKASDCQGLILLLIKTDELITIQEMPQYVKVSEKTIKRELATLQELGIFTREGGCKDGRWVILKPQE